MTSDTRARLLEAGAVTTAGTVAATILCCVPFATGIVGAALAAVGARFDPWRPWLTAISVACLGFAFYFTYRPQRVTCTPDGCEPARSTRMRQLTLWSIAVIVVLLLTASWWTPWIIYWTL